MLNKNKVFKKKFIAHALVMAFGVGIVGVAAVDNAYAQSNATSTIYGNVASPAGASIQILNTDTGFKRTINLDAAGRYTVTALPAGHYKVELIVRQIPWR